MGGQSIVKPRKKRLRITGKNAAVTQRKILGFLAEEATGTILEYDGMDHHEYTTPKAVRDKGIIVCANCGVYCSDSLSHCKYCHDQLVYIRPQNEITSFKSKKYGTK